MRKYGRKWGRRLALGAAFAGLFVWGACGDDDVSVSPTPEGKDAATKDTSPPRGDATIIIDEDAPDEDVKKPPKVHGPYDAGAEDFQRFDGGDIDGGIPCVQGGELEIEGNDTPETANPLNPPSSRCGVARMRPAGPVDAGADADAGDAGDAEAVDAGLVPESDFMTFFISKEATDIYVQYHGDGVQVLVTAGDGGTQDITQPGVTLPFKRNVPYYVEVRSKTGKPETWRVSMFEDK